jgi:hypothetical protein
MLNFLSMVKSVIDEEATSFVRLPERETLEIIVEIEVCQVTDLSLNLFWFLANQTTFRMLIRDAVMTSLHWGFQFL